MIDNNNLLINYKSESPINSCKLKGRSIVKNKDPWNCHSTKKWSKPISYKGLWRGTDVNSGAEITSNFDNYNFIIKFDYAAAPNTQFNLLFRGKPPYTQEEIDTYGITYCNNNCGIPNQNANIISWNTGGGVAPNWGTEETNFIIDRIPLILEMGYNGLSLDVEYIDPDFTKSQIESIAAATKKCNMHFSITTMGWGPQASADVSWENLDFTNIDVFMPQCYDQGGITYSKTSVSSPSKICEYWVKGGPSGKRSHFTPCKVPANKLAVGLGKSSNNSNNPLDDYTEEVKQFAKAGYIIWGSKWNVNWTSCK